MATPDPAVQPANFRTVAAASPGATPGLHVYGTDNTAGEVETAGYFNPVKPWLNVGDIVLVSYDTDGSPGAYVYAVATIPAGDVTITAGSAA